MVQSLRWLVIKLEEVKLLVIVIGVIGILLFASPIMVLMIQPPSNQQFSVIYLLGENHTLDDIPFNIKAGTQYFMYLGVQNNMAASSYYTVLIKIANGTEQPSINSNYSSQLPTIFQYRTFLPIGKTFESPFAFKINDFNVANGVGTLSSITINGVDAQINKISAWNAQKNGYFFTLLFELWSFDQNQGTTQYSERFVTMNLNMTV